MKIGENAWALESAIRNRRITADRNLIGRLREKLSRAKAPLKRERYLKRIRAAEVRIVAMTLENS